MTKDEFEKARKLLTNIDSFKNLLRQHRNNSEAFNYSISLPTELIKDDVLELLKKSVEKLESEWNIFTKEMDDFLIIKKHL